MTDSPLTLKDSRLSNVKCGRMLQRDGLPDGQLKSGAQKVSDAFIGLAEIKPGDKVLDIATGIGEPAVNAAGKVKPDGKVVVTDISPQMLAIATTRAVSLALDSIMVFRETHAEKLDLPQSIARFDAILSKWGLMLIPNLHTALFGIRQMLVQLAGSLQLSGLFLPRFHGWICLSPQ
jgi:SAM-dependent methyltransferase